MKTLVAYYSRADENYFKGAYRYIAVGNTRKAAEKIAAFTGAELFEIKQKIPYAADYNTCIAQAKKDKESHARPELVSLPKNVEEYDEIYLCYPNYWGTMPMAVYTFLEAFDFSGKKIYPLCTHEGSGLSSTERDISSAAKGAVVMRGLAVFGSEVDVSDEKIKNWINKK